MTQIWAVGTTVAVDRRRLGDRCSSSLKYTIGLRPSAEVETEGLDISEHGERAYNY